MDKYQVIQEIIPGLAICLPLIAIQLIRRPATLKAAKEAEQLEQQKAQAQEEAKRVAEQIAEEADRLERQEAAAAEARRVAEQIAKKAARLERQEAAAAEARRVAEQNAKKAARLERQEAAATEAKRVAEQIAEEANRLKRQKAASAEANRKSLISEINKLLTSFNENTSNHCSPLKFSPYEYKCTNKQTRTIYWSPCWNPQNDNAAWSLAPETNTFHYYQREPLYLTLDTSRESTLTKCRDELVFRHQFQTELSRLNLIKLITDKQNSMLDEDWLITYSWITFTEKTLDKMPEKELTITLNQIDHAITKYNNLRSSKINALYFDAINEIIMPHLNTVATKYKQTITSDSYGNLIYDLWQTEMNYFIDKVVIPTSARKYGDNCFTTKLDNLKYNEIKSRLYIYKNSPQTSVLFHRNSLINYIEHKIQDHIRNNGKENSLQYDIESLHPRAFEQFCAEILRRNGWEAQLTQASGDQGVDIIAKRDSVKAVFQCKKYSKPVGNAAVQEIIAGRQFENANIAAVVSNARYTTAAQKLANTANVHLLHYSELEHFSNIIGIN